MQQDSRLLDDVNGNQTESASLLSENKPIFQFKCIKIEQKKTVYVLVAGAAAIVILFCILVIGIFSAISHKTKDEFFKPTVILISLDGFRAEYLSRNPSLMPNIMKLGISGVKAKQMQPVFPSKTFPNHYTLVTGLFPESHGIISNHFFDPVFNATFDISNAQAVTDARWWGGEPIWVSAIKQGQKAATYFWPGSEAPIMGVRPSYYLAYNQSISYGNRVQQLLSWIDEPEESRPSFLCVYFEIVDSMGHSYGPFSPEVDQAIQQVDAAIGNLIDGLTTRGFRNRTNIIIVSDHGMTQLNTSKVILIDQYINMNDVNIIDFSPVLSIIPNEGREESIYNILKTIPNISVFYKNESILYWHFRNNRRITPIIGVADLGWSITTTSYFNTHPNNFRGGNHGYDNRLQDMQAIFIANGPSFKEGYEIDTMINLNVYSLICEILGLSPAPNNGTVPFDILQIK